MTAFTKENLEIIRNAIIYTGATIAPHNIIKSKEKSGSASATICGTKNKRLVPVAASTTCSRNAADSECFPGQFFLFF